MIVLVDSTGNSGLQNSSADQLHETTVFTGFLFESEGGFAFSMPSPTKPSNAAAGLREVFCVAPVYQLVRTNTESVPHFRNASG